MANAQLTYAQMANAQRLNAQRANTQTAITQTVNAQTTNVQTMNPQTANTQMANAYKTQQVMTASPEQLTLLLYNGALRFLNESILAMEQGNIQKAHNANMRVQNIVREFVITLDMNYEISKNFAQLYEYTEYCLIQGNIKRDVKQLQEAKNVLEELRDAWTGAMKQSQLARVTGK